MADNIIGSVSIKVVPDTKKFRAETLAKLKTIESSLKALKIDFKADYTKAAEEAKKARKAAEKAAEKAIDLRFDIDDQGEIAAALKQVEKELDKFRDRVELNVELNEETLREAEAALRERLDEIAHLELSYDPDSLSSIESAISQIDKEIAKERIVSLGVKLDGEDLREQRARLQGIVDAEKAAQAEIERAQKEAADRAAAEQKRMAQQAKDNWARIVEQMELAADNANFAKLRAKVEKSLAETFEGVQLKPDVDGSALRRKIDRLYSELTAKELALTGDISEREKHRLKDEIEEIKAQIEVGLEEASVKTAQIRLAFLGRHRVVTFTPVIDEAGAARVATFLKAITGARLFGNFFSSMRDMVKNVDQAVPKLFTLTTLITNLGGYVLTAASNIVTLGGSIASMAGASLALPGILGGMALGVGAFVAVIRDFNDVLPTFQSAGYEALSIGDAFSKLQDQMSADFWDEAREPIKEMVERLFPQFAAGLRVTADQLGGFTANLARAFQGKLDGALASMFDDLGKSIEIAGRYTSDYAGIIKKLGAVGAGNLPKLAEWFGEISKSFDGWLKAKGPQGLQDIIDTGIKAMQDFGEVIKQTGRTLGGLYRAAEKAGGSTLSILADTMTDVADAVNGIKFQNNLVKVLEAAHKGMTAISNKAGPAFKSIMERISDLLGNILPKAGDTLGTALDAIFGALDTDGVQSSIEGLFENIQTAVESLAPHMPALAEAFTWVVDGAGKLGKVVAGTLGPAITTIVNIVRPFVELLKAIPGPVGDVILQVGLLGGAMFMAKQKIDIAKTSLMNFASNAATAQNKLRTATGNVAGLGGAMLLMQGQAAGADSAMGNLATVGGAALMGFATAGPVGAAIGAAAGGLLVLKNHSDAAAKAAADAIPDWTKLADTLDMVSGATTAATRAAIYDEANRKGGLFDALKGEDISRRQIVAGIMGEGAARRRLDGILTASKSRYADLGTELADLNAQADIEQENAAAGYSEANEKLALLDEQIAKVKEARAAEKARIDGIEDGIGTLRTEAEEIRERSRAITDFSKLSGKVPKEVKTQFKAGNIPASIKDVARLAKNYKLTPKQIKTVLDFTGVEATVKKIKNVRDRITEVDKVKPNMDGFVTGVQKAAAAASTEANKGGKKIVENVKRETKKAKVDFSQLPGSVKNAMAPAKSAATAGGEQVGSNLKSGIIAGFAGTQDQLASQAAAAVHAAVAAAKRAGEIKSPSRAMARIGAFLGDGLAVGMKEKATYVAAVAADLIQNAMAVTFVNVGSAMEKFAENIPNLTSWLTGSRSEAQSAMQTHLGTIKSATTQINQLNGDVAKKRAELDKGYAKKFAKLEGEKRKAAIKNAREEAQREIKRHNKKIANLKKEQALAAQAIIAEAQRAVQMQHLEDQLNAAQAAYDAQVEKIKTAKDELEALKDTAEAYANSIRDAIIETGNFTGTPEMTFAQILETMTNAANGADAFNKTISDLISMGLNDDTIKQLVAAGPEAAGATAAAIAEAGTEGVRMLNEQAERLRNTGTAMGANVSQDIYGAAIQDAAKEVARLEQELVPLEATLRTAMNNVMQAMVEEARRAAQEIEDEVDRILAATEKAANATGTSTGNGGNGGGKNGGKGAGKNGNKKGAAPTGQTFIYNAAPNRSSSREEFFGAVQSARARW